MKFTLLMTTLPAAILANGLLCDTDGTYNPYVYKMRCRLKCATSYFVPYTHVPHSHMCDTPAHMTLKCRSNFENNKNIF